MITDGDSSLTTAAVIFNGHPTIYILRYKQSEPKLSLTHEIKVAPDSSNPNLLPFDVEFYDYCRLVIVKTYDGSIMGYRIPEVVLEIDKHTKGNPVPMEEEEVKKILKYPLMMLNLEP